MAPALRLLGRPRWQRPDGSVLPFSAERRLQLLALLGHAGQWVARERLAEMFWPGRAPPAARGNLRKVLHELRALGVDGLEEGPAGLRWAISSDLAEFRQACARRDWPAAAAAGAGSLLEGMLDGSGATRPGGHGAGFADWLAEQRADHAARWREAVLLAAASGDAQAAWTSALALLDADPLDEEALAAAWRAGQALGRGDEAQALWQRFRARLAEELSLEPPRALLDLIEHGTTSPSAGSSLGTLIGRQAELAELAELLSSGRLVTIIGPGGVGKTRLARQAAQALAPRFAGGALFVALDGLSTPAALPACIAAALRLNPGALNAHDGPTAALGRALAAHSLLLVLDGFEAVIDSADAAHALLAAAHGLRLLVTSRERLDVEGEWLLPLGGLAVPPRGAAGAVLRGNAAVSLFAERARALGCPLTRDTDFEAAGEIARRLGGLPLALELAAAWARVLPPAEIAVELAQGLGLLAGDAGLDTVFERSWAMLTAAERQAFARLAVFRGGFTREAARQVADIALPLLAALVDKSMLRSSADGRFDMHMVLAAQALRRLAALPEHATLAERHSRWFLSPLRLAGAQRAAEHENILAAWRQAVERGDVAAVDEALGTLPWGFVVEGRLAEAVAFFEHAAQRLGMAGTCGAHLRAHAAWMLLWLEHYSQAQAMAEAALAILQPAGHAGGTVLALRTLGHAARRLGRYDDAVRHLSAALACAEHAGLIGLVAAMRDALAMVLNLQGRHEAARAQVYAALALNDTLGDEGQRMYNHFNLSRSHSLAGQPASALPWSQAALEMALRIGYDFFLPYARTEHALVLAALGRADEAMAQAKQGLDGALATGDRAAQAWAHEARAQAALARGDAVAAGDAVREAVDALRGSGNVEMARSLRPVAQAALADHGAELAALLAELETPAKRPAP